MHPSHPSHVLYFASLSEKGQFIPKAINDFKNAIKYGNEDELYIVNYNIAVDFDSMEKYKDAITYYEKFIASNAPDDELKEYATSRLEELKEYLNTNGKTN